MIFSIQDSSIYFKKIELEFIIIASELIFEMKFKNADMYHVHSINNNVGEHSSIVSVISCIW